MNEQLQAIVTVLSLVNPAIRAAMFAQATAGEAFAGKLRDATKACVAIAVAGWCLPRASALSRPAVDFYGIP